MNVNQNPHLEGLLLEAYDALRNRDGMTHAEAVALLHKACPELDAEKALARRGALVAAASGREALAEACAATQGAPTGSALLDAHQALVRKGMTPAEASAYLREAFPGCQADADLHRMQEFVAAASGTASPAAR